MEWFGQAGHFCDSKSCRFHLHTHIKTRTGQELCISTVGEYYPGDWAKTHQEPAPLGGCGHTYETLVFHWRDGVQGTVIGRLTEHYTSRDAANRGHTALCLKLIRSHTLYTKERTDDVTV